MKMAIAETTTLSVAIKPFNFLKTRDGIEKLRLTGGARLHLDHSQPL